MIEARTQIIQQEAAAAARRYRQLLEQERQQAAAAARQRAQLAAMRQAAANQNAQRMVGSSGWTRFFGGVRMIGGVVECIIGVGGAAETAGVSLLVTAHGVDVAVAGFRQMVDGEAVDTGTSQLLQAAGMSQEHANIIDGGISIVGTSAVAGFTAPGAMAGSVLGNTGVAAAEYPAQFMEGATTIAQEGTSLAGEAASGLGISGTVVGMAGAETFGNVAEDVANLAEDSADARLPGSRRLWGQYRANGLGGINPTGCKTNCVDCSIATAETIAGNATIADTSVGGSLETIEQELGGGEYFQHVSGQAEIEQIPPTGG